MKTDAEVIVLCGVHFMAETAKLLNPGQDRADPRPQGRLLARRRRSPPLTSARCGQRYPGVPVVTYVNTSAEVKAESDVCCTSGNAVEVVEALGSERVIFLPDEYLAQNTSPAQTAVEIISWAGHCEVHERFTGEEMRRYRARLRRIWWCWRTRNVRRTCSPRPISSARPRSMIRLRRGETRPPGSLDASPNAR